MEYTERMERFKNTHACEGDGEIYVRDDEISNRIASLLNHPDIDESCMVDAYYYDNSVIPEEMEDELSMYNDVYLIFGITKKGEIVNKWVGRYELDSTDPIVDGKVVISNEEGHINLPDIRFGFRKDLLSTPVPKVISEIFST